MCVCTRASNRVRAGHVNLDGGLVGRALRGKKERGREVDGDVFFLRVGRVSDFCW